jgi:hypothetical protein
LQETVLGKHNGTEFRGLDFLKTVLTVKKLPPLLKGNAPEDIVTLEDICQQIA